MRARGRVAVLVAVGVVVAPGGVAVASAPPDAPTCDLAPADRYWAADATALPRHPDSEALVAAIGADASVHPDFGAGTWDGGPIGIPFTTVAGTQERVPVSFVYDDESDPGPYPIPDDAPIEGGPASDGDRHVLVLDRDACVLHELYDARPDGDGWTAGSGAVFDLADPTLRPDGWTSADAAGLPILPGLVRYDEVAAGTVDHAVRLTVPRTRDTHVWPARHHAGVADPSLPPMGTWVRLRADVDLSELGPQARVVAQALQVHGGIVADNGSAWYLSGAPDPRWDDDDLHTLHQLSGRDFEVVDAAGLVVDPDSARIVAGSPVPRLAGGDRVGTATALSRWAFPDGAPAAVVVRADDFPDALAAGPLAAALGGPVLLTPSDHLAAAVADELDRLAATEVVVVGGTRAVSAATWEALAAPGRTRRRISGPDRFATAAAIASELAERQGSPSEVLVALGAHADPSRAWPDALVATPLAVGRQAPLLLTTPDGVPTATAAALDDLGADTVTVLGGTAAVPEAQDSMLAGTGRTVRRVAGSTRYDTALAVADRVPSPTVALVATGTGFADALAAGPAADARGGVVLLTPPDGAPPTGLAWVDDHDVTVEVVGGAVAVPEAIARAWLGAG